MPFSIVILTYNEAANLEACLDSVSWADDVVVVDSFSTDGTVSIAESRGARVIQRKFDDFGSQRNYAHEAGDLKHRWVFYLDADERFNEALRKECERVVELDEASGYLIPDRVIFLGKWIRHSSCYPNSQVRLVKQGEVQFAKAGHGQRETGAKRGIGRIDVGYDHHTFSKGIEDWIAKHNRYSTKEALSVDSFERAPLSECFASDPTVRRRAIKSLTLHLPFRPCLKFIYLYIVRRDFWMACRDSSTAAFICSMRA